MARGSLGAGGSLTGFTGQGLQPTLLLPFILRQKDTNPLRGPISGGSTSPKGSHASAGRRGWDVQHPRFGEEESTYHTFLFLQRRCNPVHTAAGRQGAGSSLRVHDSPALPALPPATPAKRDAPGEQGRALRERENAGTLAKVTPANSGTATAPLGGRAGSTAVNGKAGGGHKTQPPAFRGSLPTGLHQQERSSCHLKASLSFCFLHSSGHSPVGEAVKAQPEAQRQCSTENEHVGKMG